LWSVTNSSSVGFVRSSPSHAGRSPVLATKANSDDELIKFLNSSESPISSISEEVSSVNLLLYFTGAQAFSKPRHLYTPWGVI
jgi:hypothetical protein